MEQVMKKIGYRKVSIFQPYHLMKPANNQVHFFKKITKNFVALIASALPAKQRAIRVEDVATAMMLEFDFVQNKSQKIWYYTSDDMRNIIVNYDTKH